MRILPLLLSSTLALMAQGPPPPDAEPNATDLAKATQNPVGDIVSVPFQFNFNNGGGLKDATLFNLNFQPVIPIRLSENWILISRTILPIDSFPGLDGTRYSGTGDIQEQTFFTPAKPGGIIWGIGPAFSFPTATASPAQTGTWAAGASLVLLEMTGPWVLGALVNQLSPLADANGEPRTNAFLLQWFVNYNFGKGWALTTTPSNTANWDAPRSERWTVPLGMGISRTFLLNRQPMSLSVQYYYNVERPAGTAGSLLRFSWTLIFPVKPKGK
jgi:hypothetical protein